MHHDFETNLSLPIAYNDCTCFCHTTPNVYHCMPCCYPISTSICSRHIELDPECITCNSTIYDLIPEFDALLAEAEIAGEHKCISCHFVFYKTVDNCPLCNTIVS